MTVILALVSKLGGLGPNGQDIRLESRLPLTGWARDN